MQDGDVLLDLDEGDDFVMRVMESKPQLLRDNPFLKEVEKIGSKDPEYYGIIHALRTGSSNKSLPPDSEARKMGGEWDKMGVMDEAEVVYISGDDGIDRIYPPKGYREYIIELTHKGGKHQDIVLATCSTHYRWPKMKQQIKQHISNYKTYFKHKPNKTEAKHSGLSIPIEDLSPMDWLSTDLIEIKDKPGKKSSYLVIIDRASAFVRA